MSAQPIASPRQIESETAQTSPTAQTALTNSDILIQLGRTLLAVAPALPHRSHRTAS